MPKITYTAADGSLCTCYPVKGCALIVRATRTVLQQFDEWPLYVVIGGETVPTPKGWHHDDYAIVDMLEIARAKDIPPDATNIEVVP